MADCRGRRVKRKVARNRPSPLKDLAIKRGEFGMKLDTFQIGLGVDRRGGPWVLRGMRRLPGSFSIVGAVWGGDGVFEWAFTISGRRG